MNDTDPPIAVRRARDEDAAALAALATHLGYPADEASMRARMNRIIGLGNYETLVAEDVGRIIGFAGMMLKWVYVEDAPRGEVLALVVDPAARGRGVGAALMAAAEAWLRDHGVRAVHLTTALHREGAHRFYERIGYTRTSYRYAKKLYSPAD